MDVKRMMQMRRIKLTVKKESGLTLIEVVASIVILSIVLISFASLFLQSTKHTKYNKEKLTAVEVAELVVADIRSDKKLDVLKGYEPTNEADIFVNKEITPNYDVEIKVSEGPSELDLKKAIITVTPNSDTATKKSSFTTEMYFDEEGETP